MDDMYLSISSRLLGKGLHKTFLYILNAFTNSCTVSCLANRLSARGLRCKVSSPIFISRDDMKFPRSRVDNNNWTRLISFPRIISCLMGSGTISTSGRDDEGTWAVGSLLVDGAHDVEDTGLCSVLCGCTDSDENAGLCSVLSGCTGSDAVPISWSSWLTGTVLFRSFSSLTCSLNVFNSCKTSINTSSKPGVRVCRLGCFLCPLGCFLCFDIVFLVTQNVTVFSYILALTTPVKCTKF